MYSAVKTDDRVLLTINNENICRMANHLLGQSVDKGIIMKMLVPKNLDIISFTNDLALKRKIGPKYIITNDIDTYHPDDYIFHQSKLAGSNSSICNVCIKDVFDDVFMAGGEDCPGTKALVEFYKNSYKSISSEILNKNSLFVRGNAGIFSIIERNLAEFVTYLSWSKMNEVIKYIRSVNPDVNTDLASSFEVVERTDGVVYDIIRKLKENKDSSFFMVDGKTGNKIKMLVDGLIPEAASDLTSDFYHQEFLTNLASYRAGTVEAVTGAIRSADERIRQSLSSGVKTGLALASTLVKQGWKIETVDGRECFVYPNKVYVTTVVGGKHNKRFTFPQDCRDLLYIYDITVPIDTKLYGLSSSEKGVRARGFHPHRSSGANDIYEELGSVTSLTKVCIGDLDGAPIEKIALLPDTLSGAYQPSMMGNLPSKCVLSLFGRDLDTMSSVTDKKRIKQVMDYIEPFIKNKNLLNDIVDKATKGKKTPFDESSPGPSTGSARAGMIFTVKDD